MRVRYEGETTQVDASPLGIDAEAFREAARRSDDAGWVAFCADHDVDPARQVVVGVDRLDYTKGIPERLDALEHLWESRPELRGAFTYVQKGCESRSRISEYRQLQTRIEARIEDINRRFGTDDWTPIAYTTERLPREQLCGLYRRSDAALVTPLRDGMNLVAQEYVAAQVDDPGVLVLSHLAGAHDTFGDAALTVDPRDTPAHAETIVAALAMPEAERRRRMGALQSHVHEHDLDAWIDGQLAAASRVGGRS
jgi:trehalose 6-phosphate synthase